MNGRVILLDGGFAGEEQPVVHGLRQSIVVVVRRADREERIRAIGERIGRPTAPDPGDRLRNVTTDDTTEHCERILGRGFIAALFEAAREITADESHQRGLAGKAVRVQKHRELTVRRRSVGQVVAIVRPEDARKLQYDFVEKPFAPSRLIEALLSPLTASSTYQVLLSAAP